MTTVQDISGELSKETVSCLQFEMQTIEHCVEQLSDDRTKK